IREQTIAHSLVPHLVTVREPGADDQHERRGEPFPKISRKTKATRCDVLVRHELTECEARNKRPALRRRGCCATIGTRRAGRHWPSSERRSGKNMEHAQTHSAKTPDVVPRSHRLIRRLVIVYSAALAASLAFLAVVLVPEAWLPQTTALARELIA